MHPYEYIGCFFDRDELFQKVAHIRKDPLSNEKTKPHITFVYAPQTVPEELFGAPVAVTVTGYGNDGHNEGLQVVLTANDPVLNKMIAQIPVPHITLAVSDDGQAVNTRYITFSPISPFEITGHFDGHIDI